MRLIDAAHLWRRILGAEGLIMLAASLVVIGLTGGISLLLVARRVVRVGGRVPSTTALPATVAVPSRAPRAGMLDEEHRTRLERAMRLHGAGMAARILLLGGRTRGAPVSEAELGRRYLVEHGVEGATVLIEDSSRHTLENLIELRRLLPALGGGRLVLVSNRYHLARCAAMSTELGLPLQLCAAEPRWTVGPRTRLRVAREAFLLHWYLVGRFLARRFRYGSALARIT